MTTMQSWRLFLLCVSALLALVVPVARASDFKPAACVDNAPHKVRMVQVAPGVELERDVLAQAGFPLRAAEDLRPMGDALFRPEPMGLRLEVSAHV